MDEKEELTYKRLLEKSQEAFILAIELHNRPTIRYHAEGCCFFLCNAWELMLKAYLIKSRGMSSIYYPNKQRTLSLDECLSKVFTNINDPLRKNLQVVCELRNTSTHFVTEEYELFYGPILQQCVSYYDLKLSELHGVEISDRIPENYLALSVRRGDVTLDQIHARYDAAVVEKMLSISSNISTMSHFSNESAAYFTELRLTKKQNADLTVRVADDSDNAVTFVKSLIDPTKKYIYRTKTGARLIDEKLRKKGVAIWVNGIKKDSFNSYHFGVFVDFYQMKGNEIYSFDFSLGKELPSWGYSQQAIDLMIQESLKNPKGVIDGMREELTKRKKGQSQPQEQGNSK